VEVGQQATSAAAHVEAESAANGMGLVKLMGQSAGHIALHATLSNRDVDCCLIPRRTSTSAARRAVRPHGLEKGHAVVVVAEGAGQRLISRHDPQQQPAAARRVQQPGVPSIVLNLPL
jgi:6-phosphofructokinase 1